MSKILLNGRAWDSFDGYLFDIDGTLLHCRDAVHYFAFCEALKTLTGRALTLEGVTAHGNTDVGILRDALKLAGMADDAWRPRLAEICAAMGRFVTERRGELDAEALPFVRETLEHLEARGAKLGVATGNLGVIGRIKLEHVDLMRFFTVEGWSDCFETRAAVFAGAVLQMRAVVGKQAALCVLGDTPADVEAARANGLPVIAVATGVYSREELLTAGPELCVGSLAELFAERETRRPGS